MTIKLVFSDLAGTLIFNHPPSELIRLFIGEEEFKKADAVFKRQMSGTASIEEAFRVAGELTTGLPLRNAIEYGADNLRYVDGLNEYLDFLSSKKIPLVINSTVYSVVYYAMRNKKGKEKINGFIGNNLIFRDSRNGSILSEEELETKVGEYFHNPDDISFNEIEATGQVDLGVKDESAKAALALEYARKHFPRLTSSQIAHIGDTMSDAQGIYQIARAGGVGIAFNYNDALREFLEGKIKTERIPGQIKFVDPKSPNPDLKHLIPVISKFI